MCGKAVMKSNFTRKTHNRKFATILYQSALDEKMIVRRTRHQWKYRRKSKELLKDVSNIFNPRCKSFMLQGKWVCSFYDKQNVSECGENSGAILTANVGMFSIITLHYNVTFYISLKWNGSIPNKFLDTSLCLFLFHSKSRKCI